MTAVPERWLQDQVRVMCVDLGLAVQHMEDPRRSWLVGWPDLVIIGQGRILYRELKREGEIATPEQRRVGAIIRDGGGDWAVWYPHDLMSGQIARELDAIMRKDHRGQALPVGLDCVGAVVRPVGVPGPRNRPAAVDAVGVRMAPGGNQRRVDGTPLPRGGVLPVAVPAHGVRAVPVKRKLLNSVCWIAGFAIGYGGATWVLYLTHYIH